PPVDLTCQREPSPVRDRATITLSGEAAGPLPLWNGGAMPELPTVTAPDVARTLATVLLPPVVKGPIVRRPRAVGLLGRHGADDAAVRQMQRLRERYGPDPVQLNLAGRRMALLLDPEDVHRVLNHSPERFTPASLEKRGALGHF